MNDLLVDTRHDVANWSRVRGTFDSDHGKLELVHGLQFHITALRQGGGNMGSYIGSYRGPISGRQRDAIALGVVYSRTSGVLNRALSQAGLLPFGSEKALEANYALQITRWFTLQPVFRYYFDTGANPYRATARWPHFALHSVYRLI